jgi:hypothetical protein
MENTPFHGIDPDRLVVAAHELAHALLFKSGGIAIGEIRVFGQGGNAHGHVDVPGNQRLTIEQVRRYLAATLAGRVADQRWCDEQGLPRYSHSTCAADMADFRQYRRQWSKQGAAHLTDAALRKEASHLVGAYWPRIHRLAPRLAERGSISL